MSQLKLEFAAKKYQQKKQQAFFVHKTLIPDWFKNDSAILEINCKQLSWLDSLPFLFSSFSSQKLCLFYSLRVSFYFFFFFFRNSSFKLIKLHLSKKAEGVNFLLALRSSINLINVITALMVLKKVVDVVRRVCGRFIFCFRFHFLHLVRALCFGRCNCRCRARQFPWNRRATGTFGGIRGRFPCTSCRWCFLVWMPERIYFHCSTAWPYLLPVCGNPRPRKCSALCFSSGRWSTAVPALL